MHEYANLNPTTSTTWYAHIIDANNCTFILTITIASDPTLPLRPAACSGSGRTPSLLPIPLRQYRV
jgi:hypothetical protein